MAFDQKDNVEECWHHYGFGILYRSEFHMDGGMGFHWEYQCAAETNGDGRILKSSAMFHDRGHGFGYGQIQRPNGDFAWSVILTTPERAHERAQEPGDG